MQVTFSTFLIALSFFNFIPNPAGSPPGSPGRSSSLTDHSHSSPLSSPVHTQASPTRPLEPQTQQEWHQERARKWGKHTRKTGARFKEFGNEAIQAARKGNLVDAAKNAGKSCVMGIICGGAAAVKAAHKHQAKKLAH